MSARRPANYAFALAVLALAVLPCARAQILYTHAPDGGPPWPVRDIWSMAADGSNIKPLTTDGHSHNPSWSPDGRTVLFVHDSALQVKPAYNEQSGIESFHPVELYVMNRDGSNRRLLRRMEPVIYSAVWSPDGKMLAISTVPPAGDTSMRHGLFLLPASAQGEPRLLFPDALTPAWSPDGKKLAFSIERPRGRWAVHVGNSDGSGDKQLTDPYAMGGAPSWSPDGKRIAFDQFVGRNQQIFLMDADGSHQEKMTSDSVWSCGHPTWSADGKQLFFGCRTASTPCGTGISSAGTPVPECARRIFTLPVADPRAKLVQLGDSDAAEPHSR